MLNLRPNQKDREATIELSCSFGTLWAIEEFGQYTEASLPECEEALDDLEQDIADFAYYPPDCNMWDVDIDYYDALVAGFDEQCKG